MGNPDINNPRTWKPPRSQVGATVSNEVWNLSKELGIGWSQALDFGVRFLAGEIGDHPYPECKLLDKSQQLQKVVMDQGERIEELENKSKEEEENDTGQDRAD